MTTASTFLQFFLLACLFGAAALVISWLAWGKGFYSLPAKRHPYPLLTLPQVVVTFVIFISVYILFAPMILRVLAKVLQTRSNNIHTVSLLQLIVFLTTAFLLSVYTWSVNRLSFQKVWKDHTFPETKPFLYDMGIGLATWFIAFPCIVVVSELSSALTLFLFGELGKDQIAIQYLKLALSSPLSLFIALLTILVGAPLLEEYLFRGILQSWLRNKLSPLPSIAISSFAFALFHLAPSQGIGNITLFFSLFTFAIYLGFIYEKQRSLLANVTLHMTFNLISVVRILFS